MVDITNEEFFKASPYKEDLLELQRNLESITTLSREDTLQLIEYVNEIIDNHVADAQEALISSLQQAKEDFVDEMRRCLQLFNRDMTENIDDYEEATYY